MVTRDPCPHFVGQVQVARRRHDLTMAQFALQLAERIAQAQTGEVFQAVAGKKMPQQVRMHLHARTLRRAAKEVFRPGGPQRVSFGGQKQPVTRLGARSVLPLQRDVPVQVSHQRGGKGHLPQFSSLAHDLHHQRRLGLA